MTIRTFTLTLRNPQIYFDKRLFLYYIVAIFKLSRRYYTFTLLTDPTAHWYCEGSLFKLRFHIYIHPGSPRGSFTVRRTAFSLSGLRRRRFGARRTPQQQQQ